MSKPKQRLPAWKKREPQRTERRIEVEIDDGPPCPRCGTIGAHYCPGEPSEQTIYVGVRKKQ